MLQKFDERNRDLFVNINGELMHRDKAGISPFDSAVQGGDAVWEGLRLYNGRLFKLHEHLDRLERQPGRCPSPKFRHAKKSSAKLNARSLRTKCGTEYIFGLRSRVA